MIKISRVFILTVFLSSVFMPVLSFSYNQTDAGSNSQNKPEKGWLTVKGLLYYIEMDNFKETNWKELAVLDEKGQTTILIGSLVSKLLKKEGKTVTVTGVIKPDMQVKGKAISVLEVRYIDEIK